jgi:hypothetical protein
MTKLAVNTERRHAGQNAVQMTKLGFDRGGSADIPRYTRSRQSDLSFDDLVSAGKDPWRDDEAEGLRRFKINHQLEPGRLLHR